MRYLSEHLRKASDIESEPIGDVNGTNVQTALSELAVNKINRNQKGVANGVATLSADGKISEQQMRLPTDGAELIEIIKEADGTGSGLDADLVDGKHADEFVWTSQVSGSVLSSSDTDVASSRAVKTAHDKGVEAKTHADDAHDKINLNDALYEKLARKNKAGGYAGLDSAGLLSPNQIPGQTIVNVYTYASTDERNAFTDHQKGDMAIIEDNGTAQLYILKVDPAGQTTTNAQWLVLQTNVTIDVQSWNNRTGHVMPAQGDYTTALVLHESGALDDYLTVMESGIPRVAADLDAYTKTEADAQFVSSLSDSVISNDSTTGASSKAAKTAYDKGVEGLDKANSKLDQATGDTLYLAIDAQSDDSARLGGALPSTYFKVGNLNSSVTSSSEAHAATSKAARTAYDKGVEALNKANTKLDADATAVDAAQLGSKTPDQYFLVANLSSLVTSSSEAHAATSKAAKTAHEKGVEALNKANTKLDADATAVDSSRLGNKLPTAYVQVADLSSSVISSSPTTGANSQAAKTAYDKGVEALNKANTKLDADATAVNATKLNNQSASYYRNASNLNSGTLPVARLPKYRVVTGNATLNHGEDCLVDLTQTATVLTINLPASPEPGHYVSIMDAAGLADTKGLIISGNGERIMSSVDDVNFDVRGYQANYIYLNSTVGWVTPEFGRKDTYVPAINSEQKTASAGQQTFDLQILDYKPGYQDLQVSVNGVTQPMTADSYTEDSSTRVTLSSGLEDGDLVNFSVIRTDDGQAPFAIYSEVQTAVAGQTTVDLQQIKYHYGYLDLSLHINGVLQERNANAYDEMPNGNQVKLREPLRNGDLLMFSIMRIV